MATGLYCSAAEVSQPLPISLVFDPQSCWLKLSRCNRTLDGFLVVAGVTIPGYSRRPDAICQTETAGIRFLGRAELQSVELDAVRLLHSVLIA